MSERGRAPTVPSGHRGVGQALSRGNSQRKQQGVSQRGRPLHPERGLANSDLRAPGDALSTCTSTSSLAELNRTARSTATQAIQQLHPKYQQAVSELCRYMNTQCQRTPNPSAVELIKEWADVQLSKHPLSNVSLVRNTRDLRLHEAMSGREKRGASPARSAAQHNLKANLEALSDQEIHCLAEALGNHLRTSSVVYTKFTQHTFRRFLEVNAVALVPNADKIFTALDGDGSGDLDFREFMAALLSARHFMEQDTRNTTEKPASTATPTPLRAKSAPLIKTGHQSHFYEKRKKAILTATSTDPPANPLSPVGCGNDTTEVLAHIAGVRGEVHILSMIGSPTDDDLDLLEQKRLYYDGLKTKLAKLLLAITPPAQMEESQRTHWEDLLSWLTEEGDERAGSVGLLTAMLNTFGAAQFASVIESGDVFANNCVDGNRHFLEALLHHQDALSGAFDRVDLITSACFSQGTRKCDLMLLLLKEVSISGLCQDLQEVLTDLFLEILHSQEEARYRLQERLLNDEELVLGLTVENCLVPCCRLGDLQLFALLQKHVPYVVKPWLLLEDGTAAVLGAIMSDHTALLGALLELPKTDVNVDVLMDAGTPLGIATALERTEIIKKLTEAGATKKVCNLGG